MNNLVATVIIEVTTGIPVKRAEGGTVKILAVVVVVVVSAVELTIYTYDDDDTTTKTAK